MMLRRVALPVSFVLGLFAIAACGAETEGPAPSLCRTGCDKVETPAASGSTPTPSSPSPEYEEPNDVEPTPAVEAAVKKELTITWKGQETGYWCGPGSTRMAISAFMEAPPSQADLATLMGTTTNGTNHIGLVRDALNKYIPDASYVRRDISDPATDGQRDLLKKDIVARVSKGFPMVANVVSGWRPAGYPGGTIYHYVAIVGYDESGEKVLIADPAAQGSGGATWTGVPKTYWVSIDNLATWIGGKGYTG